MILNIACGGLLTIGIVIFFGAVMGVLRFPDFYSRVHAAGISDTLSTIFLLTAFAVYQLHDLSWPNLLVVGKIFFIIAFISLTGPTSTHALMHAGYQRRNLPPVRARNKKTSTKEST